MCLRQFCRETNSLFSLVIVILDFEVDILRQYCFILKNMVYVSRYDMLIFDLEDKMFALNQIKLNGRIYVVQLTVKWTEAKKC